MRPVSHQEYELHIKSFYRESISQDKVARLKQGRRCFVAPPKHFRLLHAPSHDGRDHHSGLRPAPAYRKPTPPVFAVVFSWQIINGLTVCIATGSKAMGGDYEH
jgi:hypothetical protein